MAQAMLIRDRISTSFICRIMTKGFFLKFYLYVYEHYTIYELPWDSSITWIVAALAYDCGYYWFHRAAHGKKFINMTNQLSIL